MIEPTSTHVLIVDDEASVRAMLTMAFQKRGWSVAAATDGAAARAALSETPFDLVMLDKNLPDTTGIELLRRVRRWGNRVPVILMTAFSSTESAVEAMELRIAAYLTKPFDNVQAVVARARLVVERHRRRALLLQRRVGNTPAAGTLAAASMERRFLVVSAEGEGASWMAKQLIAEGGKVQVCSDSAELTEKVGPDGANVVLLDCSLGERTVLETLHVLTGLESSPLVLVSGQRLPVSLAVALVDGGAGGFLQRPFGKGAEFRQKIRALIRGPEQGADEA